MGKSKQRHILILRLSALGDIAISAPLIKKYALENPDIKFTVLSHKLMEPLFAGSVNLFFIPFDAKKEGDFSSLIKLQNKLYKLGITDVADIHNVLRTKVLRSALFLRGIRNRIINKNRGAKKRLVRGNNKELKQLTTSMRAYENVLVGLGLKDLNFAFEKIASSPKVRDMKLVGIAPFAKHRGKTWSIDSMEECVSELSKDPNIKVFLFGGGKEESLILAGWEQKYANTESLAGKLSFKEEMEVIKDLDFMVSMDSGNMHFASCMNTPVVSVWGATHPFAGFYGWGQDMDDAIGLDMPCRPCSVFGNKTCIKGDYPCLSNISPSMVVSKILNKLYNGEKN